MSIDVMRLIARYGEDALPDGSMQLAHGANRVCRQLVVPRTDGGKPIEYELRMRFTIPEDGVLDLSVVELSELSG